MEPVGILPYEPPAVHALEWLPLAVRFKLDAAGLKIRLAEWQALGGDEREALLVCPAGARFEALLRDFVPEAKRIARSDGSYDDYLQEKGYLPPAQASYIPSLARS